MSILTLFTRSRSLAEVLSDKQAEVTGSETTALTTEDHRHYLDVIIPTTPAELEIMFSARIAVRT